MTLVNDSGLDPVDAGSLAESWRQQPGSPVYCTKLTADQIPAALKAARKEKLAHRRDMFVAVLFDHMEDETLTVDGDYGTQLSRIIYS